MMNFRTLAITGLLVLTAIISPTIVGAQDLGGLNEGLDFAKNKAEDAGLNTAGDSAADVIFNVIYFLLGLMGVVAVAFLIIAGFIYITSLGDEKKTAQAKHMILYIIIGIVLIFVSAVIVNSIIDTLGGGS